MIRIRVAYETGNSFGSNQEVEYLDGVWTNAEIVKENITRIFEHNKAVTSFDDWRVTPTVKEERRQSIKNERWFVRGQRKDSWERSLKILLDNGKEYTLSASSWIGYFESLENVEGVIEVERGK